MATIQDTLLLPLTKTEIINIIKNVKENIAISKLDNLRNRHPNIQFDCLLRGYIGEYAIHKWFASNDIVIDGKNLIENEDGMDIDFLCKGKSIELKTSLIPDSDATIENVIKKRDIKLLKRENRIEEFRGDVHLQIVYKQRRKAKDQWLASQSIDLANSDYEYLYNSLLARAYLNTLFVVGWMDKEAIIEDSNKRKPNEKTWTFAGSSRLFWHCPIRSSRKPMELIEYLKNR